MIAAQCIGVASVILSVFSAYSDATLCNGAIGKLSDSLRSFWTHSASSFRKKGAQNRNSAANNNVSNLITAL